MTEIEFQADCTAQNAMTATYMTTVSGDYMLNVSAQNGSLSISPGLYGDQLWPVVVEPAVISAQVRLPPTPRSFTFHHVYGRLTSHLSHVPRRFFSHLRPFDLTFRSRFSHALSQKSSVFFVTTASGLAVLPGSTVTAKLDLRDRFANPTGALSSMLALL